MFYMKRLSILIILLSTILIFVSLTLAQDQEEQEVTEEFFYAEEEVEIASLKPTKIEEAPSIVSVITAQQIKDMGARDLNDILRMVPGFQLSINSWYSNSYSVRGLTQLYNTRILIMMDGVPLNEVYWGQSCLNWADMPINNVKRVEVIRGPGSALYGTYAFLAVINIITNNANDIDGIEFSAGGSSWNTQHHYLLAGKSKGDFSISGYVDYRKSDGYDNYWIERDLVTLLYSYVPFLPSVSMAPAKIQVPLDSKRIDVRMRYKDFEFQLKTQDYERGMPFVAYSITERMFHTANSYISQMIYDRNINKKFSFSLKGSYYYHRMKVHGQAYPRGIYGPLLPGFRAQGFFSNGVNGECTVQDRSVGIQSQINYIANDRNRLTIGFEYANMKTKKPFIRSNMDPVTRMQSNQMHEVRGAEWGFMEQDADRDVIAFFMQDSWQITERLDMTAGLRVDYYSDFGSSINPRISFVWKLHEKTNLKLLYGHAFRAPTFCELYTITTSITGNENLGPEKARSFEIGFNHKLTPRINTSFNYFYNALADIILPTGEIIIPTYPPQLENSGKLNSQGIEAEIKANFEKNSYAFFNYSYAKAKDELTGKAVPDVANHLFNFGLNVGVWKYLNANLNVNYVGERKRGLLTGFPDPRNPVAAYALSNLTLRAQNFWENMELILSIHNLFDKQYTDPEPLGLIYYDFPCEGRQILGKVIFKF
jgi:outer membrane cobalamin receptor